jgi:DNA replication protein DnaC
MNEEWAQKLKYLRLRNLLEHWDEYLEKGRKGRYSNERLLKYILDQEYSSKNENARHQRRKRARMPESWELATYPFKRQPKLDRKRVVSLYDSFDYMTKIQNMAWLGPTGVGKTGLATSFMNQAIDRGYTGRFILFPELLEELYASVADHSEKKVLKRYVSYDCLHIDEVGYVEVEQVQVGHFFTLMHRRHKKSPTFITSNLGFDEWRSFLNNDHLAAALIDRFTENCHVFNMKECISLRTKILDKAKLSKKK